MEDEIYKKCVSTEEIYDILNGEASEELCDLLAEHIKHCEKCRHEYESIKAISSALKDMTSEPSADFAKNTLAKLKKVKKNPILRITGHPAFKSVTAVAACLILVFIVSSRGIFGTAEEMLFKQNNNDDISVISENDRIDETFTDDMDVSIYTTKSGENISDSMSDKVDAVSEGEPIPAPAEPSTTPVAPENSGDANNTDDSAQNSAVTVPNATEAVEPLAPVPPAAPMVPEIPADYSEPISPDPDTIWVPTGEEDIKEATVQTDPNYVIPDANKPENPVEPPVLPTPAPTPVPVVPNSATSDAGGDPQVEIPTPAPKPTPDTSSTDHSYYENLPEIPVTICPEGPQPVTNPSSSDSGRDVIVENPIACDAEGNHSIPEFIYAPSVFGTQVDVSYTGGDDISGYADYFIPNTNYMVSVKWYHEDDPESYIIKLQSYGYIPYEENESYYYLDHTMGTAHSRTITWYKDNTFYEVFLPLEICNDGNELKFTELTLLENPAK